MCTVYIIQYCSFKTILDTANGEREAQLGPMNFLDLTRTRHPSMKTQDFYLPHLSSVVSSMETNVHNASLPDLITNTVDQNNNTLACSTGAEVKKQENENYKGNLTISDISRNINTSGYIPHLQQLRLQYSPKEIEEFWEASRRAYLSMMMASWWQVPLVNHPRHSEVDMLSLQAQQLQEYFSNSLHSTQRYPIPTNIHSVVAQQDFFRVRDEFTAAHFVPSNELVGDISKRDASYRSQKTGTK